MNRLLLGLLLPVVLLAAWEYAAIGHEESFVVAPPSDIVVAVFNEVLNGNLPSAVAETLVSAAAGLLVGGALGLAIGVVTGLITPLGRLMAVTFEVCRPIPSVAIIPIALLVFGVGFRLEVSVVSFGCFWPMLLLSQTAVGRVEPRLIEVARALGIGFLQRVWLIVLPASLPTLFLALRLAVAVAFVVAITVEIAANPRGLGYGLMEAQMSLQPAIMFAYLLSVGTLGWAVNTVLMLAERHLFKTGRHEADFAYT